MKRRLTAMGLALLGLPLVFAASGAPAQPSVSMPGIVAAGDSLATLNGERETRLRTTIERHLQRPYVWGATGLKSYDCSGFVWRVMAENGILIKRTTARKFNMSLPKVPEQNRWDFGNIVFFSNLKHCGIVDTRESFFHAAVTAGTHRSRFDPLWRRRLSGVRAMPPMPAVADRH